jgi:hypothetical protein
MSDLNKADVTPWGGGILSAVGTDVLVVATSSNLGAYGVSAALAIAHGRMRRCAIRPRRKLRWSTWASASG